MGIGTNDFKAYESGEGKVCIQAKWPIRPELIPVSVGVFLLSLDRMLVHRRGTPSIKFARTRPIYAPGWKETL